MFCLKFLDCLPFFLFTYLFIYSMYVCLFVNRFASMDSLSFFYHYHYFFYSFFAEENLINSMNCQMILGTIWQSPPEEYLLHGYFSTWLNGKRILRTETWSMKSRIVWRKCQYGSNINKCLKVIISYILFNAQKSRLTIKPVT